MDGLPLPLNGNVYNLYIIVLLLTLSGSYEWQHL